MKPIEVILIILELVIFVLVLTYLLSVDTPYSTIYVVMTALVCSGVIGYLNGLIEPSTIQHNED